MKRAGYVRPEQWPRSDNLSRGKSQTTPHESINQSGRHSSIYLPPGQPLVNKRGQRVCSLLNPLEGVTQGSSALVYGLVEPLPSSQSRREANSADRRTATRPSERGGEGVRKIADERIQVLAHRAEHGGVKSPARTRGLSAWGKRRREREGDTVLLGGRQTAPVEQSTLACLM